MTINLLPLYEDMEVMRCYTHLEMTDIDFKPGSYNRAQICRYIMYGRRYGSSDDTPGLQRRIKSQLTFGDVESHSYNANTAHHEALRD